MIERVILNVNDRVYSFLNPSMVISFEFACSVAEDIKNHNMGKHSICGHILSCKNYEIVVTSVDFMRNNFYPMGITAVMRD